MTDRELAPESPKLALHDGAVLFLANRASPYLLHDLEQIAEEPGKVMKEGRPLSVLVNPPSTEKRPRVFSPALDEVIYPFPSNAAQRQVADALAKNEIVVVQGPPGNGKSLTIANLVADLVAQGKSVLVSSHKQQALTVVRDKLAESGQRFLYASLTGSDRDAKRELQRQIADVKAFAGNASQQQLERQLRSLEARRKAAGERYRELREEFIARAEPEQEEASRLFTRFRSVNLLPLEDPALDPADRPGAAEALRELYTLAREHCDVWRMLRESSLAESHDVSDAAESLATFIHHQEARLAAASDLRVRDLVERWQSACDAEPELIGKCRELVAQIRSQLSPALAAGSPREAALALANTVELLGDVNQAIRAMQEAFDQARSLAPYRAHVAADPRVRAQVVWQHAQLPAWNPIKRRGARTWLDQNAPGAAGLLHDDVTQWSAFWDAWERLRVLADGLAGGLRTSLPATFDPDEAQRVIGRAQQAATHAFAISTCRAAATELSQLAVPIEEAINATTSAELDEILLPWQQALAALEADRAGNAFRVDPALEFLGGLTIRTDDLIDAGRYDEASKEVAILKAVLAAIPAIARRRQLLDGPLSKLPRAVEQVERHAEERAKPPPFLADVDRALAVHGDALRFEELRSSPNTRRLAEELTELTEHLMRDAGELLGARIQERILKGFRTPSFLSSLEMFRKAVGGSPKRFERFEELKTSPTFDVDVLTDVFPCWIMRPEDVCRVFPLRPDVFDVLIMDEASQCNPDQALPLFARAKKVAIFGDDKQLSNEDLKRSLSNASNQTLLRQSGLGELDPTGLFDQTKHSLLELASRRQQASVLLNEHFRCRPEIIAFSNDRFYGNTLRVMRDRRDDRGLGSAMLIRRVEIDDPVPGAKVNYVEAEALVDDLVRRLEDDRYEGMTFGVLSLFREQVEHLEALIEQRIPLEDREARNLICSTVDGFQGDERDVILYSWRHTEADHPAVFAFTNGAGGEQRTNVALTRARHQAVHFVSVPIDRFPRTATNIAGYLNHARHPDRLLEAAENRAHKEPSGLARQTIRHSLLDRGLEVAEDYVACGVSLDLLVHDPKARKRVAVFVDADRAEHRPPDTPERVDQHAMLERAGWRVVRIPATEGLPDPEAAVREIAAALDASPQLSEPGSSEEPETVVSVGTPTVPTVESDAFVLDIAPEDRSDYHWDVPSVEARLNSGEAVFMSDFERQLYDLLARCDDLQVVPQWPSRGKAIDFVLTDREGRRLAVEADGPQHHETNEGGLIPEDIDRQALLEEAGWVFHRVSYRDFIADPEGVLARIRDALKAQPANARLKELVWGGVLGDDSSAASAGPQSAAARGGRERDEIQTPHAYDVPVSFSPSDTVAPSETPSPERVPTPTSAPDTSEAPIAEVGPRAVADTNELTLDDVELRSIVPLLAATVETYGEVPNQDLVARFQEYTGIAVPRGRERLLMKCAWSGKGRRFLEYDRDAEVWQVGPKKAQADERYGEWTFHEVVVRAAELLRSQSNPFDQLVRDVYDGDRPSKLAKSIVGSAIHVAKSLKGGRPA